MIDIITIYHNKVNKKQSEELYDDILKYVPRPNWSFITVDNTITNRGFAVGCNYGAAQSVGEIILFCNPDVKILGDFYTPIIETLVNDVVVTGERFNKPKRELDIWGVRDWCCGAVFAVKRDWFVNLGGFDERFTWGWEETDFIRQTESRGKIAKSIKLPVFHASPEKDSLKDSEYKRTNFDRGAKLYYEKWNGAKTRV